MAVNRFNYSLMKGIVSLLAAFILLSFSAHAQHNSGTFPSEDGLEITYDHYPSTTPAAQPYVMILCHQARWSRGEYRETAPEFAALGYECYALDQRSGGEVKGVKNETFARAKAAGKDTKYLDAEQDIRAAVQFVAKRHPDRKIILVGSSYSSTLVLSVAVDRAEVAAVASFSPGDYLSPKLKIRLKLPNLHKPYWVTSSKTENPSLVDLMKDAPKDNGILFKPAGQGYHGARALWTSKEGSEEYRTSFFEWLGSLPKD